MPSPLTRSAALGCALSIAGFSTLAIGGVRAGYIAVLISLFTTGLLARSQRSRYGSLALVWLIFLAFQLVGAISAIVFRQEGNLAERLFIFDVVAYVTIFLLILFLERAITAGLIRPIVAIYSFVASSSAVMAVFIGLFLTLGPAQWLSSGGVYFSPLVTNLHHTAISSLCLLCGATILLFSRTSTQGQAIAIFGVIVAIASAVLSGSSKALGSIGIWAGFCASIIVLSLVSRRRISRINLGIILSIGAVSAALALLVPPALGIDVAEKFASAFSDLDTSQEREFMYRQAFARIQEAPFFGSGPGRQIVFRWQWWDPHSSILALPLQTGLVGSIAVTFTALVWLLSQKSNVFILLVLLVFCTYFVFGDLHRNAQFWLILCLASYYSFNAGRASDASKS